MKNKQGFTLIELLAVIVILAVIALIVTPVITGIIKKVRDSADLRSAEAYVKAGENYFSQSNLNNSTLDTNVIDNLDVSSKKAEEGSSLVVNNDGTTDMAIIIDDKCYRKTFSESIKDIKVTDITNDEDKANCNVPLKSDYAFLKTKAFDTLIPENSNSSIQMNSISKVDNAPATYQYSWDISDTYIVNNSSIMAYAVKHDEYTYDVLLESSKPIASPVDSSHLLDFGHLSGKMSSIINLDWLNTYFTTDMSYMFNDMGYEELTELDLGSHFDTSNVLNMSHMFERVGSSKLIKINFGDKFNTSKVLNMSKMFFSMGYDSLTSLTLPDNFDAESAVDMSAMFEDMGRYALTTLNLGANFNAASATDMRQMFNGIGFNTLKEVHLGANFNVASLEDSKYLFSPDVGGDYTLEVFDLGDNFNGSKIKNMSDLFFGLGVYSPSFQSLNLGKNFDTSSATNMNYMFEDCGASSTLFTSLSLGDKFDTSKVTNMESMFFNTGFKSLTSLDLGHAFKNISSNDSSTFYNTGASGCQIKVSSDIYSDSTHFKLNKDSSTTIEYTRGTLVSTY